MARLKKENNIKAVTWLKRLGWAGFLFFTVKGIIWLALFMGIGKLIDL